MSSSEVKSDRWAEDLRPHLAKYELFEELGHGGMATVYRAQDRRLAREVAVKIIHRHLRENREVATRFTAEARAVAKLRHPNIVDVYDVSDDDEPERYLVVELVRGTTLRKLIEAHGHFPAEIAAAITIEVADALEHAHEQGVIHRDVKPENVLVDTSGLADADNEAAPLRVRIKITDFGIAKLLDAQGVTSTGQVLGSPAHMAPEQIEGGQVTARADVFGLGVLLYECLVGKLPFDGRNPAQVLRRVLDGTYTAVDRARPSVGVSLGRVVDRALAHEPEQRFGSARELAAALRAELAALDFVDPRRELDEFLRDAKGYLALYEQRIVSRLVELGRTARAERRVAVAAAHFNRALALRPDDLELLRQVSSLARGERFRQNLRRTGLAVATGLGVAALSVGLIQLVASLWPAETVVPGGPAASARPSAGPPPESPELPAAAPASVAVPGPDRRSRQVTRVALPKPVATNRPVRVQISSGALAGIVVVGDCTLHSGESCPLKVGQTYSFEFRPPPTDKGCCDVEIQTVKIGETEPVVVTGEVPFRRARVIASRAPPGSELQCGAFAPVVTPADLQIKLPSDSPSLTLTCTVIPPAGDNAFASRKETVTLAPGKTTDIWP